MSRRRAGWATAAVAIGALTAGVLTGCSTARLRPNGLVTLSAASRSSPAPARAVAVATVRGPAAPASTQPAPAACPSGTTTSGGGIATTLIGGGKPPSSLHVDGTSPAGSAGKSLSGPGPGARGWSALGATGGQIVLGGVTTAYAMCIHGTPFGPQRIVVARAPGPALATTTVRATASCPSGTLPIGGGGLTAVAKGSPSPSLHLIGSFPSDSKGVATRDSSTAPTAWSAVADAGGRTGTGVVTTAFAICVSASRAHIEVRDVSLPGPLPASGDTTVTAGCPPTTDLISGGAETGPASGTPQQGLHLTGSFPSDAAGLGVGSAPASHPADSWTARAEAGGQGSPSGTLTTAFALCLTS